jgi:hypothetical protein
MRRGERSRWLERAGLFAAAALVAALAGCGSSSVSSVTGSELVPAGAAKRCLPSPLRLSAVGVRAGATVTVSSGPFACRASYPVGKTYTLILGQVGRGPALKLGVVPVTATAPLAPSPHLAAGVTRRSVRCGQGKRL